FETFSGSVRSEMTTPTGAAILAALARPVPAALAARRRLIGYGAGDRDFRETPNLLRIFIGPAGEGQPGEQEIVELQTNIDDMNPQFYGPLLQHLIAEGGALDVFYHPVVMKLGRPGVLLTVLCEAPQREKIAGMLFRETTTLGVRYLTKRREILNRSFVPVITRFGQVRIKIASLGSDVINYAAEFEDCQRLAQAAGAPLKDVYNEAMAAYWETRRRGSGESQN
ncbi:MAG: LarC family nickel insertion protein, partial [Acidobacteria bacterium]|nr:LarC family nickel insertion protein [Acidobacteriota bacterium]